MTSATGTPIISSAGHERGPAARVAWRQLRIEARERHDDRDLHQFGGLQVHEAQVEPALAAAADKAEQFDRDQQDQHADIGEVREILENPERQAPDDHRDGQEDEESARLCCHAQGDQLPPAAE